MPPARRPASLFALAAAFAVACTSPGGPLQGWPVRVSGDYVQPATGARLPERLGALTRMGVTRWDDEQANVAVSYDEGQLSHLTLYLYPAGDAGAGRLLWEFRRASDTLEQLHPAGLREGSAIVRAPHPDERAVGYEARFKLLDAAEGALDHTLLQLFQCGRWFWKLRATYAAGYAIDAALDALHAQVLCGELARRDPIGTEPGVRIDPSLPGSGNATVAWIAYGTAQLAWVEANVASEDLVYGIPDHDPRFWQDAWEHALRAYDGLQRKKGGAGDPFLARLVEVRDAGFLAEYVWREHFGFLPTPADAAPRLEAFERWREAALPRLQHELRAAAYLHGGR